jgi:hypothetical protein
MLLDVERPRGIRGLYGQVVIPPAPASPELQASKVLEAVQQLLPVAHQHLVGRSEGARERLRKIAIEVRALRTELAAGEVTEPTDGASPSLLPPGTRPAVFGVAVFGGWLLAFWAITLAVHAWAFGGTP